MATPPKSIWQIRSYLSKNIVPKFISILISYTLACSRVSSPYRIYSVRVSIQRSAMSGLGGARWKCSLWPVSRVGGCGRGPRRHGRGAGAAGVHGVPGRQPALPREPAAPREGAGPHLAAGQAPHQGGQGRGPCRQAWVPLLPGVLTPLHAYTLTRLVRFSPCLLSRDLMQANSDGNVE